MIDFNPANYSGVEYWFPVSDDVFFAFAFLDGRFMVSVNLGFKLSAYTFLLYMRVYNSSGVLVAEGSEATVSNV